MHIVDPGFKYDNQEKGLLVIRELTKLFMTFETLPSNFLPHREILALAEILFVIVMQVK